MFAIGSLLTRKKIFGKAKCLRKKQCEDVFNVCQTVISSKCVVSIFFELRLKGKLSPVSLKKLESLKTHGN